MKFKKRNIDKQTMLELYRGMLFPRMIEEKMIHLLRQGFVSKWFSGIGQEAISVGCAMALEQDETIFTMHRNLGVFTSKGVPLNRLFSQWQGKANGFTQGRDRSFHFGSNEHHIVGMISHLGPQLSVANGVGLAHTLSSTSKVTLAFTGEGGTSQGEFHEALNVASVWQLPVIFVIENNGYGLSTPTNEQYRCKDLAERAKGYGMKSKIIDGNNILEVYTTICEIAAEIRENPEPFLIECKTFRRRGHEEASGVKYVPKELIQAWEKKDPIRTYEQFLTKEELLTVESIAEMKTSITRAINEALEIANSEPDITPDASKELQEVYAPFELQIASPTTSVRSMRMIDAINDGLDMAMQKHDNLILMGQDIADYGGVFKVTEGLLDKYGSERVRNTPLCESAILGAALGLSIEGYKAMVEMQFADFVTVGFNQIINNLAKTYYRWGQQVDVVVRMPTGGGMSAGPFHSQSNEAWFTKVPGLKVVFPSTPEDAKGLLLTAFEDPNPILFFEHKGLYRATKSEVSTDYYTIPFGQARYHREGDEMSIITYGMGVQWALEAVEELGVDADILDLRTLVPMDYQAIRETVQKTGRVLILHEDTLMSGIGGEISAYINEHLFEYLDAPVMRCASMDTPIPFAKPLEQQFLAKYELKGKIAALFNY